ncbi:MAG: 16S rRNA (cytidine(1402)-2'-O)-methyltransferase [Bacteroidetes bacterium]|nr:16S rRNA (cytidine(1402)-2'-O)-methyltransferase [Bacteroidota bacterium]
MTKLFLVPTPIGNLEDITLRAIRILKEADIILAEDTRKTGILLKHLAIEKKMLSHHQFNEHKTVQQIIDRLKMGECIALVSDAGTPSISDPGFLLIRECIKQEIDIECLPGPTAFIPALVMSGIPTDHFIFEGFLPHKKGRKSRLERLSEQPYTMVFYESPYRLIKTLEQFVEYFGPDRKASVSKELTKIYEKTERGTLIQLAERFKSESIKGEFVIIVEGYTLCRRHP